MNSSRSSFLFFALAATTALSISACSSGDVPVGSSSSQQQLRKTPSGGPTGNGQTCSWDDTVSSGDAIPAPGASGTSDAGDTSGGYHVGDTFKSPDGCNDCSCSAQGILCTLRACAPAPGGGGTCSYGGKTYASGASFPSTDGCNSCGCQADGNVACTERACAPAPTCKKTGCSGEVCSDQDIASTCQWQASYACYQSATCTRQPDGQCGFTQTAALTQCLATTK